MQHCISNKIKDSDNSFDYIIIGEGTLTLACAQFISKNGLTIKAVVSNHEKIIEWSKENHILHVDSSSNYIESLKDIKFDYLLCIINENKLSDEIINQATICSINYHDSILPTYSGVHASAWAIINGEKQHGITWHVMNDKIDSGDIILSKHIDIKPNDTSLTLNLKCFDCAVKSLPELIAILSNPPLPLVKQDNSKRTIYYKADKPQYNGILTSAMSLVEVSRLLNAAYFGHVDNDFFSIKILIGNDYYFVLRAECIFYNHSTNPGVLIDLDSSSITLSIKGGFLKLTKLANSVNLVSIEHICKKENLKQGMLILSSDNLVSDKYMHKVRKNNKYEKNLVTLFRKESILNFTENNFIFNACDRKLITICSIHSGVTNSMFLTLLYKLSAIYLQKKDILIPFELNKNDIGQNQNKLFLNHSFLYIDSKKLTYIKEIDNAINLQLFNPPLFQSDILWRYNILDKSLVLPPALVSFEKDFSKDYPIIFNYYNKQFNLIIDKNIINKSNLMQFLDAFKQALLQPSTTISKLTI